MTPRERLIENIIDIVHATRNTPDDEKLAHLVKLLLATLKTHYSIARWVSVEERLPERSGPYMVQWSTKREANPHDVWFDSEAYKDFGGWACINRYSTITHWLELDLPSWKEDA